MVHWDHYEIRSKFLGDFSLPLQGWVYFFCLNCDILLVLLFLPNKVSKNILTCLAGICRGYICRVIKLDPLHTYILYISLFLWFLPKTVCKMKPSPPAAQVNRDVAEYENKSKNIANPLLLLITQIPHIEEIKESSYCQSLKSFLVCWCFMIKLGCVQRNKNRLGYVFFVKKMGYHLSHMH